MPEYVFAGPYPVVYTEGRDVQGRNLGEVAPGDIRDLDQAPDQWWHLTADEDRARAAAAGQAAAPEAEAEHAPEPPEPAAEAPAEPAPGE